ncbi:2OG-Fe(II) oxygenase [Sphingomonas ginkgonis]|uniref:2OG-Fe(II) oxygenase n=1 Tax=Sphingomonas ginkgonis TaxID=2315330 RepID=A0A3S0EJZ5_9SPHN|nr:2OG-Fe(II) oxygenase [Sphingomonas ginkgonis]RST29447.1 2OG-Fe(II) oxygenase [Sphingomonas ginkgonis]
MTASDLASEAVLEAVGAGRPQNWARAFTLLRAAADGGDERAGAQLAVLGSDAATGERRDPDIAALLSFPAPVRMSEQPRLRSIAGFASAAECDWLRGRGTLGPARVFDPATGEVGTDPLRNNACAELELDDLDVVTQVVRARIAAATRLPLPVFEKPQVLRYRPGEQFKAHVDYLGPASPAADGQRIATFLLFLNEDYAGGETEFPSIGVRHRGRTGDALFFANVDPAGRPDPLTLHAGNPPRDGEKWVFSQWIRDRSFTPLERLPAASPAG